MRMGKVIALLGILLVAGVTLCFWGKRVETYRDKNVSAGEITRPINSLAVHVSKPQYLTIQGKTYEGVRGLKPYYLDIPQWNSILFVTEDSKYKVTFHVVNLKPGNETQIDGGTSGFGWAIGSGRKAGEKGTDYIESVESNKLTIATRSLNWKATALLDLATKSVEREETFYYGESGQVTNREVYVNGERVK